MGFRHNSTNIKPSDGSFEVYPEGEYRVSIEEAKEGISNGAKTKGMNMIEMTLQIIEHESLHGKTIKHWVVFMPEGMDGAGMSVHFRKCIGVPYGGDDEVEAMEWIGKKLRVKLGVDTKPYKDKKTGEMKSNPRNKVTNVLPYGEDFPEIAGSDVPF
jgi:hypothetical protein